MTHSLSFIRNVLTVFDDEKLLPSGPRRRSSLDKKIKKGRELGRLKKEGGRKIVTLVDG